MGYSIDITAIAGADVDIGVPGGRALLNLVDAFFDRDDSARDLARRDVIDALGPESFFDAATVFGNFEMMNRIAEGTGIGISPQRLEREADLVRALGLERLMKSQQLD